MIPAKRLISSVPFVWIHVPHKNEVARAAQKLCFLHHISHAGPYQNCAAQ